jgi:hypothetical protein
MDLRAAAIQARNAHAELKAAALADGLESEWYEVDSALDLLALQGEQQGEVRQEPSVSDELRAIVQFLCGEAPLDGAWYGDEPPEGKPRYWWRSKLRAALAASPAMPHADWKPGMCLPDGALFDALGEPRKRYVRITLDGSHCIDRPDAVADVIGDDDPQNYTLTDVYLSEREFDDLPEFDGF